MSPERLSGEKRNRSNRYRFGRAYCTTAKEPPSHIVLPCIHKKKEIGEIFHEHLNTPKGLSDQQLTEIARQDLRKSF